VAKTPMKKSGNWSVTDHKCNYANSALIHLVCAEVSSQFNVSFQHHIATAIRFQILLTGSC